MKFEVKNRWNGEVQFVAEIDCDETASYSAKLGLAIKWGLKTKANMSGANMRGADMSGDDMSGADMSETNMRNANMRGADMSGADMRGADMSGADMRGAYLSGADMSGADMSGADMRGAYLSGAKNIPEIVKAQTLITPEGDIIGWKKCKNNVIVKLLIPSGAQRHNATGRKCRAQFADVLEVIGADVGISQHDGETEYRVGQRVICDKWGEDRFEECAGGIHFFITRIEAEEY